MKSPQIKWISTDDPPRAFPDIESASGVPDGLLAAGGDLSAERLIYAYRHGIFPWYEDGQPILWWSPDPRCILRPCEFLVSRRLRRALKSSEFEISFNRAFGEVIGACAEYRHGQQGTWITTDMADAYTNLHQEGWAHSIEVWRAGRLAGGLYGLSIGQVFFGESMFSRESNASKAAMLALCRHLELHRFELIDCQVESPHLMSLGATLMPRPRFSSLLRHASEPATTFSEWPPEPQSIRQFLD